MTADRLPVVVLISGNGSNLQALIDAERAGELPVELRAVVSSRGGAYGLERAAAAGIPTAVLRPKDYPDRERYDAALRDCLDRLNPGLVVLAGFMRILGDRFVAAFEGRLVNIHPSLLPAFRGLHTHERALAAGVAEHGCSVHYVIPELDAGPVIAQAAVAVEPDDTPQTLQQKVQAEEHRLYPLAVRWIAEGRVTMRDGRVWMDGQPLAVPPRLGPVASH
ncbi:phosphoribosylglycinamide formyltransferase [Sediminicurvatus halobius]|uniref:Phosphoribosylglycinamide formyltransferase n=1 Tax=Sediminicurvatus halobius TaxID=2182432 RepID=A0A2U2MWB5_9GAMM|nr:phosphoribosylglycinamide formyltransferase [Spiribacter halobius]PWG61076.1 phosphoribosylglycinamide formyltransferase [Spiribacter halobius]UEX77102.1 phosphoribosylglycinamide formyltransferase [Spiribacter halobius]